VTLLEPPPGPLPGNRLDSLIDLFESAGSARYGGEAVSQREHALQCARLAERDGAPPALVAAALLHDVGHLLQPEEEGGQAAQGIDGRHERLGGAWLDALFGPAVTAPVKLHVAAKRWLCAAEPGYRESLSPASELSLKLQGGPFTPAQAEAFLASPHGRDAVRLRRWDDLAKVPGLPLPPVAHYRPLLTALLRAG